MTTIAEIVDAAGGLLHKRDLVAAGARDRHLTRAVRAGFVRRPRRGWYSTWSPDDPRFLAVRIGGRLTGSALLWLLGAWMWRAPDVQVSVPRNASRLRRGGTDLVVWDPPEVVRRGTSAMVDVRDALRRAVLEAPFEEAVALLDWAIHARVLTLDAVRDVVGGFPADGRGIVDWIDPACESFIESVARTRARRRGHTVTSQIPVGWSQRIDLVIDDVVGLELDGERYHADTFEADRVKDLRITTEGRIPVRVSYRMVRDRWDDVETAVDAAVAMHVRGGPVRARSVARPPGRARPHRRRGWRLVGGGSRVVTVSTMTSARSPHRKTRRVSTGTLRP